LTIASTNEIVTNNGLKSWLINQEKPRE